MEESIEILLDYLESNKAKDLAVFDARQQKIDEDFVVLANFPNCIENKLFAENFMKKLGIEEFPEGYNKGEWIIFSFNGILLHTFIPVKREKYNLDKLYQSQKIDLKGPKKSKK